MKCSVNFSDKYAGLSHEELIALKKSLTQQRNRLFTGLVLIAVTMIAFAADFWIIPSVIFPAVLLPLMDEKERAIKQINRLIEK